MVFDSFQLLGKMLPVKWQLKLSTWVFKVHASHVGWAWYWRHCCRELFHSSLEFCTSLTRTQWACYYLEAWIRFLPRLFDSWFDVHFRSSVPPLQSSTAGALPRISLGFASFEPLLSIFGDCGFRNFFQPPSDVFARRELLHISDLTYYDSPCSFTATKILKTIRLGWDR